MPKDLVTSQEASAFHDPLIAAVADELGGALFSGKFLKFSKGTWRIGEEAVGKSRTFMVRPDEWYRGWLLWRDGEPADHVIGRALDNFLPPREPPGEGDWQQCVYLVMRDLVEGDVVTFASCSDGGRKAVAKLVQRVCREASKHPGQVPIVALHGESYRHDQFGVVQKPVFKIVGWNTWDDDETLQPMPAKPAAAQPTRSLPAPDEELPPLSSYEDDLAF